NNPANLAWINQQTARVARSFGGRVLLVDLGPLVCPGGHWVDKIDGVAVRSDGVHFTPEISPVVWAYVMRRVRPWMARPAISGAARTRRAPARMGPVFTCPLDLTRTMRNEEQETFSALGVSADLVKVLDQDGLTTPFPVQRLCIPDALAGRDVCGKAKTGSGKTLAFGLPLVERVPAAEPRRPTGLVLVPTRELCLQVSDVLRPLAEARNLRLVAVYGGAQMGRPIA